VNSRAADIHRRVQQFKADRKTDREATTAENLAAEDLATTLEIRQQLASLQQTLSTAENDRDLMAS
jgi:negative regulator of replication initiation